MIKDIKELNFPTYATLSSAVCALPDMAEKTVTSTVRIDGQIAPDFSYDWAVEFKGEKYIMPLRAPQGAKDNESILSSVDLTFQHWAVYQLKRWYFFSIVNLEAGTILPDQYEYPISLNLGDFCKLFGKVLAYYFGDKITIKLNSDWEYQTEPTTIEISHSYIWDVLIKFYDLYGVRWQIEPASGNDNETEGGERYVIKVGYTTTEIGHTFEYGFEGGLLKVERQVQDDNIRNMIIGRGGEKNLPYRYFKKHDDDNASFSPDPDWIPELKDIYFSELRGATFRSYIQGWKAAHIFQYKKDYPDEEWVVTTPTSDEAYAPWAWMRGFTDETFNPIEYVADEYDTSKHGYGIVDNSSIAKYGELMGGLDNNEDIYPTIQGVSISPYGRIDQVVDVEPITTDNIEESAENDAVSRGAYGCKGVATSVARSAYKTCVAMSNGNFTVSKGKTADIVVSLSVLSVNENGKTVSAANNAEIEAGSESVKVYNALTGAEHSASGIPEGAWRYEATCRVHNMTTDKTLNITVGDNNPRLIESTPTYQWGDTWDIWVKNIWQTTKESGETDTEYAERVWLPILGDRTGDEAKVVFSTGWLSTSEDYEFTIVAIPQFDTSKSLNGVQSHWRITLAKSDADLESTGLYLPSTKRQVNAGDYFFFIGIDMPHLYVVEAEKRLDDWKKDELAKIKDIKPTWIVSLDKVRTHNYGNPGAIIDSLHPGDTFTLRDERFIPGSHQEKLYLTSITYTYTEPTEKEANLLPDVEVVLSDSYSTSANPVGQLQGEVSALQKQVGAISNIEQIVRAVGDRLYLRKDGFSDRSYSPTEFASLLTSIGFRSGIVGGAGWGFFKDENGNWVLETDRLNVRQDMNVASLVINQVEGRGGTIIESAARMEITRVEEATTGYVCYFDQKGGTIANQFHVDDVAMNNRFTPENANLKFYKRRVIAVGEYYVILSKADVNGSGVPAEGDIIIQYGNYTDEARRYVKVLDVIGGGYERYIEGLDSVNSEGVEYYFVGRQSGMYGGIPRWFIGNSESNIEYINRRFNLNNVSLSINSTIGDKTLGDFVSDIGDTIKTVKLEIDDTYKYLKEALLKASNTSTSITGGLILSSIIALRDESGAILSGMNGTCSSELAGRTIASWYGGDMIDLFDKNGDRVLPEPANAARALFRMDGTGYLADGNIWWNADGSGGLGAGGVLFGQNGVTLGNGVKISLGAGNEGLADTLESIVNTTQGFTQLLTPIDANGNALKWSESSQAVALRANVDFLSAGEVTAYASGSTGGGMTLGGLSGVDVSGVRDGYGLVYRGGVWVAEELSSGGLDESELAAYLSRGGYLTRSAADTLYQPIGNYLTSHQSLAGYATQSWVEGKGYLTSHQSLANYVTLDGAQDITGLKTFKNNIRVGNDANNGNTIYFYGVTGDAPGGYTNAWISQRLWGGTESSELVLFAGNDIGNGTDGTTVYSDGPDRIRHIAASHVFQSFTSGVQGDVSSVTASSLLKNCFDISLNRTTSYNDIYAPAFVKSGGTSSQFLKADGSVDSTAYWHAGNDGSGSGLDADMLDGYHYSAFESRNLTVIDTRSLDENTWYPVVMWIGCSERIRIRIEGRTSATGSWNSRNDKAMALIVDYTVNGSLWGWASVSRIFHEVQFGAGANSSVVCGVGQLTHNSTEYIFVRGGAVYNFYTSHFITPQLYTTTYIGLDNQTIAPTTTQPAALVRNDARTSDNVASATKLQTARSLWGNSFDGSADCTGQINITASGGFFSRSGAADAGYSWNQGKGALSVGIQTSYQGDRQTPLILAQAYGTGWGATGSDRLFAMELLNTGTLIHFAFGGVSKFEIDSSGNFLATGEVTAYSDARLKSDIAPIAAGVRLRPVSYVKDGRRQVGLIAQDVAECCPTAVHDGGEYLALNYSSALTYALAGVYSELDTHEDEIKRLKKQVSALKKEVKRLKQEGI